MSKVHVFVGTRKGAFVYTSDASREHWEVSEPMMRGSSVYGMAADNRGSTPRLFAASNHWAWGRSVARSDDMGKTWEQRNPGLGFAPDSGLTIDNVWTVTPGPASQPGVVYAGTQPAGLFRSDDGGESWTGVDSLNAHEQRKFWVPTGGGATCLHTIEVDPRDPHRIYASIAAGGTYVTTDGGGSWALCSHTAIPTTPEARAFIAMVEEMFPEPMAVPEGVDPAAANEFHKFRLDRKNPDRLWGQAHIGVFRSDDAAKSWKDVTAGLPSFHGFPIAVTKRDVDAVFVVPLEMEEANFRVCPGQFAVYRTMDAGSTWERLTKGLPGPNDYQSVYREAMDTDGSDEEGVYVGTTNGEVHFGRNCGESWQRLPGTLPPILSVTAFESSLLG